MRADLMTDEKGLDFECSDLCGGFRHFHRTTALYNYCGSVCDSAEMAGWLRQLAGVRDAHVEEQQCKRTGF